MADDVKKRPVNGTGAGTGGQILVFGATGQQGGAVARALRSRDVPVRALVRDPNAPNARALADLGVELVSGNFTDAASIAAAMSGVHGVFSVQPSSGQGAVYGVTDADEVRYGRLVADAAVAHGVRHLVYSSAGTAGKGMTGIGSFDSKTEIEEHVRGLDLPSTIVRPVTFMELLTLPGMGLDKGCFTFFIEPGRSFQIIAASDIGNIVASIFADAARFAGRTIEIAGDEVTGPKLAETFSNASCRSIGYQRFPDAVFEENDFLARLAALSAEDRFSAPADISALEAEFGPLLKLDRWLAGPGKKAFEAALQAGSLPVALR